MSAAKNPDLSSTPPDDAIEYIDDALAAIPTKDEIDQFLRCAVPPRWFNFQLELRFKIKELAEAGLSTMPSESGLSVAPAAWLEIDREGDVIGVSLAKDPFSPFTWVPVYRVAQSAGVRSARTSIIEECAKVCDALSEKWDTPLGTSTWSSAFAQAAQEIRNIDAADSRTTKA